MLISTVSYLAANKQSLTENQHRYSSSEGGCTQAQLISDDPSNRSVFTLESRAFSIFSTPAFARHRLTPVLLAV